MFDENGCIQHHPNMSVMVITFKFLRRESSNVWRLKLSPKPMKKPRHEWVTHTFFYRLRPSFLGGCGETSGFTTLAAFQFPAALWQGTAPHPVLRDVLRLSWGSPWLWKLSTSEARHWTKVYVITWTSKLQHEKNLKEPTMEVANISTIARKYKQKRCLHLFQQMDFPHASSLVKQSSQRASAQLGNFERDEPLRVGSPPNWFKMWDCHIPSCDVSPRVWSLEGPHVLIEVVDRKPLLTWCWGLIFHSFLWFTSDSPLGDQRGKGEWL